MTYRIPGVRGSTGTVIIVISTTFMASMFILAEIRESKDEYCDGKQSLATITKGKRPREKVSKS